MSSDPFAAFKSAQREAWALFTPLEIFNTVAAAKLVKFAGVAAGQEVLDVGCGTAVVTVTAARAGANVCGLDLTPELLKRAQHNTSVARVAVDLREGDAEDLPYPDACFDLVLSQFGHIFAPRPEVATAEMLRVLRPGGRIAFSSWAQELFPGTLFTLLGKYLPPPPPGTLAPAPPSAWGEPGTVRARLGEAVTELVFDRDTLITPSLSPQHTRLLFEATLGPVAKLVTTLAGEPARLSELRTELERLLAENTVDNQLRQHFLMTRATKRR